MFENQVTYQYIGAGNVDTLANGVKVTKASDITVGALVVLDSENKAVQGTAATGTVRIAQRIGNQLIYSPFFNVTNTANKIHEDHVAATEQISYLGYNGTSGSLDKVANKLVVLQFLLQHTMATINNSPMIKTVPYKTVGATSAELALGLLQSASSVFNKRTTPDSLIKFERVAATTSVAALTGTAVIYKLTKGVKGVSTYIKTADGTVTLTASTASVTDADVLHMASTEAKSFSFIPTLLGSSAGHHVVYIGTTTYLVADAGTADQNATAIAAAINAGTQATAVAGTALVTITYNKETVGSLPPMVMLSADDSTWTNVAVTALSGDLIPVKYSVDGTTSAAATFNLDTAWQGETGYLYEGTGATTTSGIGVATLNGDSYGLKMTGLAPSSFNPIVDTYQKVQFVVTSNDFVTMEFTTSTEPTKGTGTYEQVATQEIYCAMNEGQSRFLSAYPPTTYRQEAVAGTEYDMITFEAWDNAFSDIVGQNPKSKQQFVLALYKDSTQFTSLKTVLGTSAA